jgi:hypothetical protein
MEAENRLNAHAREPIGPNISFASGLRGSALMIAASLNEADRRRLRAPLG